jgi:hypothetical protein
VIVTSYYTVTEGVQCYKLPHTFRPLVWQSQCQQADQVTQGPLTAAGSRPLASMQMSSDTHAAANMQCYLHGIDSIQAAPMQKSAHQKDHQRAQKGFAY